MSDLSDPYAFVGFPFDRTWSFERKCCRMRGKPRNERPGANAIETTLTMMRRTKSRHSVLKEVGLVLDKIFCLDVSVTFDA